MFAFVRNDPTLLSVIAWSCKVDAINAAVDRAAALRRSIDLPVIVWVGGEPPASVPVRCVGYEFVDALPPQKTKHRMVIVHRHAGTRMHMTGELADRWPASRTETENWRNASEYDRGGLAVSCVLCAQGASATWYSGRFRHQ